MVLAQSAALNTAQILEQFNTQGFVVVKEALPLPRVKALREFLLELFEARQEQGLNLHRGNPKKARMDIIPDFHALYPELLDTVFSENSLPVLKTILGENFVLLPESSAMREYFNTLHTDTTEPEMKGWTFHKEPDFRMVTVGLYLQDNNESGGGMFAVPGSHKLPDRCVEIRQQKQAFDQSGFKRLLHKLSGRRLYNFDKLLREDKRGFDIPSKAGDMIIFDVRMIHRSTFSQNALQAPHGGKLAVFSRCIQNNRHVEHYIQWLNSLTENSSYDYLRRPRPLEDLVEACKALGVTAC